MFLEKEAEMAWRGEVQFVADLVDGLGGVKQQGFRLVQDSGIQPVFGRFLCRPLYGVRQVVLRDVQLFCIKTDAVLL